MTWKDFPFTNLNKYIQFIEIFHLNLKSLLYFAKI